MPEFNPSPNDEITIKGEKYRVMPHPAVPVFAFGQEGRKAFVFQVAHAQFPEKKFALKKFKLAFRVPELVQVNDALAHFSRWEGMEVCNRQCFQHGKHDDILSEYPDLEYAVLMPWITGTTWYDIVIGETPLTLNDSLMFANATARVLAAIEEAGLAHCDIAAANVIVNPTTGRAHLIDVEDLYAPGFEPPAALPAGTDGYAHITSRDGQWEAAADRFAGAVMIAEMAAWHDPRIRDMSDEEHFFPQANLQDDGPHFQLMMDVLEDIDPRLSELLDEAWFSKTLDDCPPLKAWYDILQEAHHTNQVSKYVTNWEPILLGGVKPHVEPEESKEVQKPGAPTSAPGGIQQPEPQQTPQVAATNGQNGMQTPQAPAASQPPATSATPAAPTTTPAAPSPPAQVPLAPPQTSSTGPIKEWRPLGTISSENPVPNQFEMRPIAAPVPQSPQIPEVEVETEDEDIFEDEEFLDWVAEEVELPNPKDDSGTLLKPILQLSHIDRRGRPHLVWTESPLAMSYRLEEASDPNFSKTRTFKVKADETQWNPRTGRNGDKFYRVRAEVNDVAGPWSNPLSLHFGDA